MKFFVRVEIPTEAGNAFVKSPSWGEKIQMILQEQHAESPHFAAANGKRTCLYFTELSDAAKLPSIAEPWWLMLKANVELTPVMGPQELAKAGPDVAAAIKKYG